MIAVVIGADKGAVGVEREGGEEDEEEITAAYEVAGVMCVQGRKETSSQCVELCEWSW